MEYGGLGVLALAIVVLLKPVMASFIQTQQDMVHQHRSATEIMLKQQAELGEALRDALSGKLDTLNATMAAFISDQKLLLSKIAAGGKCPADDRFCPLAEPVRTALTALHSLRLHKEEVEKDLAKSKGKA